MIRAPAGLLAERVLLVVQQSGAGSLRPVLILLRFRSLLLFDRLLFLAFVFVLLAAFVAHCEFPSY